MPLNTSGPISLGGATVGQSINLELSQSATATVSLNDANVRSLAGVPSGAIIMPTNFYGKAVYVAPTFTTGTEQSSVIGGAGANRIANGNVIVAQTTSSGGNNNTLFFRALTVANATMTWGAETAINFANCNGGTNTGIIGTGSIMTGRLYNQNGPYDGFNSYYYKPITLSSFQTVNWGSTIATASVGSGTKVSIPGHPVTNATAMNLCVGQSFNVNGGNCGRMGAGFILHYRSYTVT